MSASLLKRYLVLYWQESHCKVEVSAPSEELAMAFVSGALDRGVELNGTVFNSDYEVVDAKAIGEGGVT